MFKDITLVFLGGGTGAVCRFLVAYLFLRASISSHFPWGTFVANCLGCLLVGALATWFLSVEWSTYSARLLLITGFAGGFTTFSTFSFEVFELLEKGATGVAVAYMLASLLLGLLLALTGVYLTRLFL